MMTVGLGPMRRRSFLRGNFVFGLARAEEDRGHLAASEDEEQQGADHQSNRCGEHGDLTAGEEDRISSGLGVHAGGERRSHT